LTLSEVFSAFWSLAHSSVLRRYFLGFGLSFSLKVLVPLQGMRLIQYSGSVLGDNNKTFRLKSYAPVVSFVYSGFFFVFVFFVLRKEGRIRKEWSRGCTNGVTERVPHFSTQFLGSLDLQGVDQSAVAKFLPNFYLKRESLIALFREVPTFHGYECEFFFLGLLLLFGILDGLFEITWLSSRRIVRNYLHVLLRRSLNRGSRA